MSDCFAKLKGQNKDDRYIGTAFFNLIKDFDMAADGDPPE